MRAVAAALVLAVVTASLVAGDSYDPNRAMDALFYIKAAYCDYTTLSDWSCPTCKLHHTNFTDVTYDRNATDEFLVFTGYNPDKNNIVVSFRGTNNLANWIKDFTFFFVDYPKCSGCKVHDGFYETWHSVQQYVMKATAELIAKYPNADEVLITGHSLGAAVSVLAAVDLQLAFPNVTQYLYNFGDPRVGNPAFVQFFADTLQGGKQFRVTHKRDPVPHLPPESFGWLHAPHELWYDNDGDTEWKDCKDSPTAEDPNCSDSILPIDPWNHVMYLGHCTNCEVQKEKSGSCPL